MGAGAARGGRPASPRTPGFEVTKLDPCYEAISSLPTPRPRVRTAAGGARPSARARWRLLSGRAAPGGARSEQDPQAHIRADRGPGGRPTRAGPAPRTPGGRPRPTETRAFVDSHFGLDKAHSSALEKLTGFCSSSL